MYVLADDSATESSKLCDAVRIGGDLGQQTHSLEVPDVAIDGFLGVPGLRGDPRCVTALEVESHNLPLVGDVAAEVVDVAPWGKSGDITEWPFRKLADCP